MPINENQYNLRALHELELIKKFKRDKENEERLKHQRTLKRQVQLEENLKEELKKRRVDLGVPQNRGGVKQELKALIYKEEEVHPVKSKLKVPHPVDRLVELEEEELRDQEIVKEFLKRNRKIWKSLFTRYSNQGYSSKGRADFDDIRSKVSQISLAEITKMLRDHNTFPQLLTKDELSQLIRLINMTSNSENSSHLTMLDYEQFLTFIP